MAAPTKRSRRKSKRPRRLPSTFCSAPLAAKRYTTNRNARVLAVMIAVVERHSGISVALREDLIEALKELQEFKSQNEKSSATGGAQPTRNHE